MVFLKLFLLIGFLFLISISYVLYSKLFTNNAIPGWASTLSVSLINTAIICLGFFVTGILLLNLSYKNRETSKTALFKIITPRKKD